MPSYSTDKGFTGSANGKGTGGSGNGTGGGGTGAGQDKKKKEAELTTRERNLNALDALSKSGGKAQNLDPKTGKSIGDKQGEPSRARGLPPGLNPLKYSPNPTQEYDATLKNIGTLIGGALVGGALPGPALVGGAVGDISGLTDELGLGFESPQGTVDTGDYDKSETTKASQGNTVTTMGSTGQTKSIKGTGNKTKKPPKPGFTLLKGVGGTLIGT